MNALEALLSSRVKAELFRLLFGPAARELHVRELERQTGLAVSTVRQELGKLARLGIVAVRRDGNRSYYRANTEHPLFPDLRGLVLKTSGLAGVLREALGQDGIRTAFVFGSPASAEAKPDSDVDLLVIGSVTLRQLAKRLSGVSERLGRELNPCVLSTKEFAEKKKSGDHFVSSVLSAPKLFVTGDEHGLAGLGE